ncbi:MAG: thiol:disulfide interchange protein DsbA/DsbL [Bdellovibrio bacteriovorus]
MLGMMRSVRLRGLLLAALIIPLPLAALDEGIDYAVLKPAQPTETGDQIEVLEVFWYGCPHCWHLEPVMEQWVATKPAGVAFRRMPATGPRWEPHARAYYAAESLGKLDVFHEALFKAMQVQKRSIMSENDLVKFAGEIGIDPEEFRAAYNSFYVEARVRKADEMGRRYGIDGVPALIINGKYRTSPSQTGSQDKLVEVLNALVGQEVAAKGGAPAAPVAGPAADSQAAPGS